TSDSPPHCRSSLAYSRRSNETIRSRDKQCRRNTLENPGRLGRLRWLPSKFCVSARLPQQNRDTRPRLVVQNHVQQRAVNFQAAAIVVDEPQPSKFIHEKADAGPCRTDILRKRLLLFFW